jgi:hypothetical protein
MKTREPSLGRCASVPGTEYAQLFRQRCCGREMVFEEAERIVAFDCALAARGLGGDMRAGPVPAGLTAVTIALRELSSIF